MLPFRNWVLGCVLAATLVLIAAGFTSILQEPEKTLDTPHLLFFLVAIGVSVLLLSRLRPGKQANSSTPSIAESELSEVHDWDGDRVEIVVSRDSKRGWIGQVRFGDKHLVWEERGATAQEAYQRAFGFFRQACFDHVCGPGCSRRTSHESETF